MALPVFITESVIFLASMVMLFLLRNEISAHIIRVIIIIMVIPPAPIVASFPDTSRPPMFTRVWSYH